MNWKMWIKGLIGAVVGGVATAGCLVFADPGTFNFTPEGWAHVWKLLLVSGFVSMFAYLKKSPVPDDIPSAITGGKLGLIAWITLTLTLMSTGCATQVVEKKDKDGNYTRYKTSALFSKAAFDKVSVDKSTKAGSNQLLGVGSYNSETQGDALAQFLDGLKGLFEAGVKAGTKTAVP